MDSKKSSTFNQMFLRIFGPNFGLTILDFQYLVQRSKNEQKIGSSVQRFSEKLRQAFLIGGSFGFAMCLSLRRYFPSIVKTITVNRIMFDLLILACSLSMSFVYVLGSEGANIQAIKHDYILAGDPDIYNHLIKIQNQYLIPQEAQVMLVLTPDQYSQWEINRFRKTENHIF